MRDCGSMPMVRVGWASAHRRCSSILEESQRGDAHTILRHLSELRVGGESFLVNARLIA